MDSKSPIQAGPAGFAATGTAPKIEKIELVAVFDAETGQVISRNLFAVCEGAEPGKPEQRAAEALGRVETFYKGLEADPAMARRIHAGGGKLCPLGQLKVAITDDPALLEGDIHVDVRTGRLAAGPLKNREAGAS